MAHAGFLRASAEATDHPLTLAGVTDRSVDTQISAGTELVAYASALVRRDPVDIAEARDRLTARVGASAAARSAAVVGAFQMMNRILDATGVPTPRSRLDAAAELGIDPDAFGGAHGAE